MLGDPCRSQAQFDTPIATATLTSWAISLVADCKMVAMRKELAGGIEG